MKQSTGPMSLEEVAELIEACAAETSERVSGVVFLHQGRARVSVDGIEYDTDLAVFSDVCGELRPAERYHVDFQKPTQTALLTTEKVAVISALKGNREQLENGGMILGTVGENAKATKKWVDGAIITQSNNGELEFQISRTMKKPSGGGKLVDLTPGTEVLFTPTAHARGEGEYVPVQLTRKETAAKDGELAKSRTIAKKNKNKKKVEERDD